MTNLIVLLLTLINIVFVSCTQRPIIGVPTQEFSSSHRSNFMPFHSYLAASYVKAIESSGARVTPIFVNQPRSYYESILKSINGVVIPGGDSILEKGYPFYDTTTIIYEIAEEINKNGIYFPILGVCQGFEAFLTITNNHTDPQTKCDIIHENYPLEFERNFKKSLLFSKIPYDALIYLKYFPITHNNHKWCTTPHNFMKLPLRDQWTITSTSTSARGIKFISTIEHKKYPFFAVQFHPEKVLFEWGEVLNIPHGRTAITANRHFYDLLVILSTLNHNKFETEKMEKEALIYNYKPIYTYTNPPIFAQLYAFSDYLHLLYFNKVHSRTKRRN